MKTLWWYFVRCVIKSSLFFYTKRISVHGKVYVPKKGAVLFMVNHPNGLLDPLVVAVNNPRILHFLVQAAIFKNPTIKKILGTLNLMPVYRIRDGIRKLDQNQAIFERCFSIFKRNGALMIFPEASHDRRRTIRPLSKGFTRIVFGALEKYPELKIQIVPVGVTYQNSSVFPSNVVLNYGQPILANSYHSPENQAIKTRELKALISDQLKELSVHIPADEHYQFTLSNLNKANVDFTNIQEVYRVMKTGIIKKKKRPQNFVAFVKPIIILNSSIPWIIWKYVNTKIYEVEFIDTFRFSINTITFPLFYGIQSVLVSHFFGWTVAGFYFLGSLILVLIYSKLHPTPTEQY